MKATKQKATTTIKQDARQKQIEDCDSKQTRQQAEK